MGYACLCRPSLQCIGLAPKRDQMRLSGEDCIRVYEFITLKNSVPAHVAVQGRDGRACELGDLLDRHELSTKLEAFGGPPVCPFIDGLTAG